MLVKDCFALQHKIDGPAKLMGKDGQRPGLVVFVCHTFQPGLRLRVLTQEQHRCLAESPLQIGVADLAPGGAIRLACRLFFAFDQTAIGGEVLHGWKALNGMDLVEDHQGENLTNARRRTQQYQAVLVTFPGVLLDMPFNPGVLFVIKVDQIQIKFDALLDTGIRKSLSDALTAEGIAKVLLGVRQVVLAVGVVHMRQQLRAFAHQMHAPTH